MKCLRATVVVPALAPLFFLFGSSIAANSCGFTLVDSVAPQESYELADFTDSLSVDYSQLERADLNIRVNTAGCSIPSNTAVDSVLIEWDRHIPKSPANWGNLSHCEPFTPYAVFKDTQKGSWKDLGDYGKFNDALLPLGVHSLKATLFGSHDCTGNPLGAPLESQVTVHIAGNMSCPGDVASVELWNGTSKKFMADLVNDDCKVTFPKDSLIRVSAPACLENGGIVKWVTIKISSVVPNVCPNEVVAFFNATKKTQTYFQAPAPTDLAPGVYIMELAPYGNYMDPMTGKVHSYAKGPTLTIVIVIAK